MLAKKVHTQMGNSSVVTIIKCGASSLLTFDIDSWALISTNFLFSVGLLDNYGANPYGGEASNTRLNTTLINSNYLIPRYFLLQSKHLF